MAKLLGSLLTAALLVANATGAGAADLYGGYGGVKDGGYVPPPMVVAPSGWYFKSYVGTANSHVGDIDVDVYVNGNTWNKLQHGFDSTGFVGLGVGYKTSRWLRFDLTGEFQGGARFHALDSYNSDTTVCVGPGNPAGCFVGSNDYTAKRRTWLGLANAYVDIWSFRGFTPYVGAGIGFAHHQFQDMTDVNVPNASVGFASDGSKTQFAWALYAGLSYDVTPQFTVDLAYRYADLGDVSSGAVYDYLGNPPTTGYTHVLNVKDITSHDLMLGLRYKFGHHEAAYVPIK